MKYRTGDKVIITEEGVNKGLIATITERRKLRPGISTSDGSEYFYFGRLEGSKGEGYRGGRDIVVGENMIKPYILIGSKEDEIKCTCGGDYLTIPHHYDWCPKGANNGKDTKNNFK